METGKHDFAILRKLPAYVDKSLLIETVLTGMTCILLIAPRRFGKSANLSLLKRFFEILPNRNEQLRNRRLFSGLAIEGEESIMNEHFGKYPVILLDFKCNTQVDSYDDAVEKVFDVVHEAYQQHSYLSSSGVLSEDQKWVFNQWWNDKEYQSIPRTKDQIEKGLKYLAEYLRIHYDQQVFLLVDEYDSLCCNALIHIENTDEIKKVIDFCIGCLACLTKSNDNVDRVILTGISYLATMGLSQINSNVKSYKFQDVNKFSKYYGLTSEELDDLLSREEIRMVSKKDEIIDLYNGYRGGMISIWSVMSYLNDEGKAEDKNYWQESGVVCNLDDTLRIPEVRSVISKLLSNISNLVEIDYFTKIDFRVIIDLKDILSSEDYDASVDVFFNFLLEQGYLKRSPLDESQGKITVEIPNREIRMEFRQKLLRFYCKPKFNLDISQTKKCAALFDKFTTSNETNADLLKDLSKLLNSIFRKIKLNVLNEATLHHIIFIVIFFCSKFVCFSEIRVVDEDENDKRLDLLLLNKSLGLGIIIELKYNKTANAALKQIITNKYSNAFTDPTYNPDDVDIRYFSFIGLNMSVKKEITLCALFNCENLEKCVSC